MENREQARSKDRAEEVYQPHHQALPVGRLFAMMSFLSSCSEAMLLGMKMVPETLLAHGTKASLTKKRINLRLGLSWRGSNCSHIGDTTSSRSQVYKLVQDLHTIGIMHEDLEPQNIARVQGGGFRLIDFSQSRRHICKERKVLFPCLSCQP